MTQLARDTTSIPPYRFSAVLSGHTSDVRSLSASSTNFLFSASRDGTARSWTRSGQGDKEWKAGRVWKEGHVGFVNSVCLLTISERPDEGVEDQRYLLTAGSDSLIQVYSLSPSASSSSEDSSSNEPVHTLLGHSHNVCSLHVDKKGKRIASASWDMTARIWSTKDWECERVLTDHGGAVWDVLLIADDGKEDELCLTACADNYVRLFDRDKVRHLFKGHTGPVRALSRVLPDDSNSRLFASASNDGSVLSSASALFAFTDASNSNRTIRIWNYSTGDALTILNHEDFVYSLVSIPSIAHGGLASSGEDGLIKVWNEEDGECDQVIEVPALSVWSLATLENGDLACGCSDNLIWVFTRSEERKANEEVLKLYEEKLGQKRIGKTPPKPVVHSDRTILESPGKETGQIVLVKEDGEGSTVTNAYQWAGSTWERVGEVVDPSDNVGESEDGKKEKREKMEFEGKEFDFVFQIDVSDDNPPIPLPYDLGDDVYGIAKKFVEENGLPESHIDQIVDFSWASTSSATLPPWDSESAGGTPDSICSTTSSSFFDPFNDRSTQLQPSTFKSGGGGTGGMLRRESATLSQSSSTQTSTTVTVLQGQLQEWKWKCGQLELTVSRLMRQVEQLRKERDDLRLESSAIGTANLVFTEPNPPPQPTPPPPPPPAPSIPCRWDGANWVPIVGGNGTATQQQQQKPQIDPTKSMSKQSPPPCNAYYLLGECEVPRCRFCHTYDLTESQVNEMRRGAKFHLCNAIQNGVECPDGSDCIYGHHCPRGPTCSRQHCAFNAEQHRVVPTPRPTLRRRSSFVSTGPYSPLDQQSLPLMSPQRF
ncbi:uncharacterized protein JCM6883_002902 [Sporobolomyces salmoneus]|uniref:uncharacterized protein n=1 Tax=Sporobolomyces salmoneus TaxID=183962 RepID=UPI0031758967